MSAIEYTLARGWNWARMTADGPLICLWCNQEGASPGDPAHLHGVCDEGLYPIEPTDGESAAMRLYYDTMERCLAVAARPWAKLPEGVRRLYRHRATQKASWG